MELARCLGKFKITCCECVLCRVLGQNRRFSGISRVDPGSSGSSPGVNSGPFRAPKSPLARFSETRIFSQPGRLLALRGVFRAHGSSPLGPVGVLLPLHGAKHSSSILALLKNPGREIRRPDPMYKKHSRRVDFDHILRIPFRFRPPAALVDT